MKPPTIGIVDYGVGNLASVWHALHALQLRCRVSSEPAVLDKTDLLLLPGVGAFPAAMAALHQHNLVDYLQAEASAGRPVVGICLGMQLLADSSTEHRYTAGLGLIPGRVRALRAGGWHIGWNAIATVQDDPMFAAVDGQPVYFNHSYAVETAAEHQVCIAQSPTEPVCAVMRRGNVVGIQFHPEKSQAAGREVLRRVVRGFCRES